MNYLNEKEFQALRWSLELQAIPKGKYTKCTEIEKREEKGNQYAKQNSNDVVGYIAVFFKQSKKYFIHTSSIIFFLNLDFVVQKSFFYLNRITDPVKIFWI